MKKAAYTLLLVFTVLLFGCQQKSTKVFTEADIAIIPRPQEVILNPGGFLFTQNTKLVSEEAQKDVFYSLKNGFHTVANWDLEIVATAPSKNYVALVSDKTLPEEAYQLEINSDFIEIKAKDQAGFVYGLESVRQLLPTTFESQSTVNDVVWEVPNVSITDAPRFQWRGLMLDLSRHYFDKEYIKSTIDQLAKHKMNVLHLHLVDDQGWRIEIKKYPKLTEVGAWRVDQENLHWNNRLPVKAGEKGTYGGFLTQEELKELVAYATTKNVELIPEIEMPAHVTSAIAAYPHLKCFNNPEPVGVPSGGVWPITDIYCAGKETTFEFLEDVLLEVMDIFPSKYIHIGGDEATKTNWERCPFCQKRMTNEGLENVEELQSYFIKRMEKFINEHDKKLVGWDEILEGGLAPDATVMSWRGTKGGVEAAEQGHDVVMTPTGYCYFDYYQGPQNEEPLAIGGYLPLSKVYNFDPIVETMSEEDAAHVLGGQANLWTEYVPTPEHSQYMLYPRLAALSEAVWSPKELRDWEDFSARMKAQYERYENQGVNHAKSAFLVTAQTEADLENKTITLTLQNEFPNANIRYALGEQELSKDSEKYTDPIAITKTTTIKAALFKDGEISERIYGDTIVFHKAVAHKTDFKEIYHENYQGKGTSTLVNAVRGTKNFHDGQWLAWLNKDMEATIDLEQEKQISKVTVGSMENQGPGIYFPIALEVLISKDGSTFEKVGALQRPFAQNGNPELKNFVIDFDEQAARYVKVKAKNLKQAPNGGGTWLFVDEILVQ
ncbi:beta-N-acetylhexosaminidase [Flagellimonas myxillae]|uniref:beta-N-acetylhexosaminidase n=1 Tax=Flagellimonas myxillae TaxID=2942214 RepID=UPI00201F3152|nr:glycoside hydrolase family 20 protein [Muricauda myxillae]MCL6267078.1 family 20 glycosylhydrolase [Muricauda myxillae]